MATRQDTNKSTEQTKAQEADKAQEQTRPQEQNKTSAQQSKQPDTSPEQNEQKSATETAMAPHRDTHPAARTGGWEPYARIRHEFDRFFEQVARDVMGMPVGRGDFGWGVDLREDGDNIVVRAEAPGFEPSDFHIHVHGNRLIMRASHKGRESEEGGYRGWQRSDFYQTLTLPTGVDPDKVKASYRQGVLTVTLPKSDGGQARRIAVEG